MKFVKVEQMNKKIEEGLIDKITVFFGILTPLFIIPQIYVSLIEGEILGVSLISWIFFSINHLFWLFYSQIHKIKPLFYSSLLFCIFQGILIFGVIYLRYIK